MLIVSENSESYNMESPGYYKTGTISGHSQPGTYENSTFTTSRGPFYHKVENNDTDEQPFANEINTQIPRDISSEELAQSPTREIEQDTANVISVLCLVLIFVVVICYIWSHRDEP